MENDVTLLNFDGAYNKQSFFQNTSYEMLEMESIANTSLFCNKSTLLPISRKLKERRRSRITFLGSGNYHYISYLLQSQIEKPYTLILFDHHTDALPSPSEDLISCGSWVLESLQHLPMLKKVFMIGVSEEALMHIPSSISSKIVAYTENSLQTNFSTILQSIIKNTPTESIYISMDKDVLDKEDALTGWDHGTLRLKQMLLMTKAIFRYKEISGVDVCGEYPANPTNEYTKDTKDAIEKNDTANSYILFCINRWMDRMNNSKVLSNA